ncbi:unnamed protein product [Symbiodinium natans]|uniref:Uncharacterized protein n=1 Tax=Symbiodinium natans TaxID=878477 RepID=A0A812K4H5_9DINO|nr:unnamed protein product [Symbiodinium natans]
MEKGASAAALTLPWKVLTLPLLYLAWTFAANWEQIRWAFPNSVPSELSLTSTRPGLEEALEPTLQRVLSQAREPDKLSLDVTSILQNASLRPRRLRESTSRKNLRLALCGLNGIQAVVTPGQIATNLNNVAQACQPPYPMNGSQQDFCAAMVSLDLALWGFLAIYIEGAVISCSPTFQLQATCAIQITGILASTAVTASAGANIRRNCLPPGGYKAPAATIHRSDSLASTLSGSDLSAANDYLHERAQIIIDAEKQLRAKFTSGLGIRRLEDLATLPASPAVSGGQTLADDLEQFGKRAKDALNKAANPASGPVRNEDGIAEWEAPSQERGALDANTVEGSRQQETARNWKRASCFFDMGKAVARVAEVAVLAASAAEDCAPEHLAESGEPGKLKCIVDITGAIASASIASTLISLSVVNCPATLQFSEAMGQRLCASAILNLVTVASYMTTSVAFTMHELSGSVVEGSRFVATIKLIKPSEVGSGPYAMCIGEALTLSFACGALAVAFFLRSEPKTEAVMASMPNVEVDDAHKWMEDPGVVEMPTKRDLGELLKAIQAHYPDGGVFEHVKYLDIDGKDPDNLKYDYNMKVFKNATRHRPLL